MKAKKSFLAGIVVSLVAYNYLLNHDLVSKVVFSVALIIILTMNLNLYTSKVATILCSNSKIFDKMKNIFVIFFFNALACVIFGYLFSLLGETHGPEIWAEKMNSNLAIVFYKSIAVGFLMQIAATCKHDLVTIGVVMLFIGIAGEHSIANIAYMSIAGAISLKGFLYVIYTAIGNAIGSLIIYFLNDDKDKRKVKTDLGARRRRLKHEEV